MDNTFQCVVVAPPGKIIDCKATSIVFPAHDGMVGVLYDHMPMFCELGLGMMEIECEKCDGYGKIDESELAPVEPKTSLENTIPM